MNKHLEESQIERILRDLALEASAEVDQQQKDEIRKTAYAFAYLVSTSTLIKFGYVAIYENALRNLELKER
jgi:propanediol dehydratase large subunit